MDYIRYYNSPLGKILLSSDGRALTGLWFVGQKYFAATLGEQYENKSLPVFSLTEKWLDLYFGGFVPEFTPLLAPKGTAFRQTVWKHLLNIPYGQTRTYGEIAQMVSSDMGLLKTSARAVGTAIGHNPISLIIPCHRVVGANGRLIGYAGGIDKKQHLLQMERSDISMFAFPG